MDSLSSQLPIIPKIEELTIKSSFDPVLRIPDIQMFPYKYIFKYLNAEDILNLSEVSKVWYHSVANSPICMSKVKIQIDFSKESSKGESPPSPAEFKILRNSLREYQNINFSCQHNQKYSEECLKLINRHRDTLIDLTIQEMSDEDIDGIGDICLPNLKVLKIKRTNESSCSRIFKLCRNLKVLHLDSNYDECLIDCLHNNRKLHDLKFSNDVFESIFSIDPLDDFPFHLNTFTSLAWKCDEITEFNFIQLLAKQAYSLTDLKLFYASHKMVDFIYNEMDAINVIDIKYFEPCKTINETLIPIPSRNEITEINFHHNILLPGVRAMIKAAPKLKVLRLKFINRTIVEFATVFCKKLRVLVYCFDVDKSEELYKILIKNARTEINKKITFKCTNVH